MNVVVLPGRNFHSNPYFIKFCDGLTLCGCQVIRLKEVITGKHRFDVLHFHFPEHLVVEYSLVRSSILSALVLCTIIYAKVRRRPIVWMVHDVVPFRNRRQVALKLYMKLFKACVTGYVFLNKSSHEEFYTKFPSERRKPFVYCPHGKYNVLYVDNQVKKSFRRSHDICDKECLVSFLGDIKPYKGASKLANLPTSTLSGNSVRLAICGKLDHNMTENDVIGALSEVQMANLVRIDTRLTDEEMCLWTQASDVIFMPYLSGSNSGLALHVLSNHGKIVVSKLPMFIELEQRLGNAWVVSCDVDDKSDIQQSISLLFQTEVTPDRIRDLDTFLDEGDYAENGVKLMEFYSKLKAALAK
jgi:beta-1,4-mannosyltransferase